jgi:DNA-binding LytR/AlgR family response regulator
VTDYVRKPVRAERLGESLRRVAGLRSAPAPANGRTDEPSIPVELAGTTRMLPRSSVRWVEAQGDYARLHTSDASHLVRVSLATLAERWADAGFVRIHRSYLVQLRLIAELRLTQSGYVVAIDGTELPVSRRHTRELKDKLIRAVKHDWTR